MSSNIKRIMAHVWIPLLGFSAITVNFIVLLIAALWAGDPDWVAWLYASFGATAMLGAIIGMEIWVNREPTDEEIEEELRLYKASKENQPHA